MATAKSKWTISINEIIFGYYLIFALFGGYVSELPWNYLNVLMFFVALLMDRQLICGLFSNIKFSVCFIAVIIFLFVLVLFTPSQYYTKSNLIILLYTLLPLLYYCSVFYRKPFMVNRFLVRWKYVLNLLWIISIILVLIQGHGTPLLIKKEWLIENPYYPDMCTGFFGKNNTHILGFFSCFMLIYNLSLSEQKSCNKRKRMLVYIVVTEAAMAYCSVLNENTSFFIWLPLFACLYLLSKNAWKKETIKKKISKYLFVVILIIMAIICINKIPILDDFFNRYVVERINQIIHYDTSDQVERIAIIINAFNNGWGWGIGRGIGTLPWVATNTLGFRHFGDFSAGAMVSITGIWFYLLYCLLYTTIFHSVCFSKSKQRHFVSFIIYFGIIVLVTVFTNVFVSTICGVWLLLTFGSLNLNKVE